MTHAAAKLRALRNCLRPALELAADMARITSRDETFAVLASVNVAPSCGLDTYALGNKLDKARFRAGV